MCLLATVAYNCWPDITWGMRAASAATAAVVWGPVVASQGAGDCIGSGGGTAQGLVVTSQD